MITTSTYLVACLVSVALFTIIAIGECRSESEEQSEDFGGSE